MIFFVFDFLNKAWCFLRAGGSVAMGQEITVENVVETSRRHSRVSVFRKDSPGNLRQCYLKVEQLSGQNLNASKKKEKLRYSCTQPVGHSFPS